MFSNATHCCTSADGEDRKQAVYTHLIPHYLVMQSREKKREKMVFTEDTERRVHGIDDLDEGDRQRK